MREDAEAKGRRYLTEGRLTVDEVTAERITATCRGQGEDYLLGWLGAWHCSCPARTRCSHIVALQAVTTATPRSTT